MVKEKIFKILAFGIWTFLAYLHLTLAILVRLIPRLRNLLGHKFEDRFTFERKNLTEKGSQSFYLSNEKAKICFQVASEGEFEQIRWLIEHLLKANQHVEIIFTSPSVEHRILKVYQQFPNLIRYLRTPLVTLSTPNLANWITAPRLIMVRYDFFPMLLTLHSEKELILFWFFRPRDRKSIFTKIKWKLILPLFEKILSSNTDDWWWLRNQVHYKKLIPFALDLRSLSIFDRLDHCQSALDKSFEQFTSICSTLIKQHSKTVIHGNAYTAELNYLVDLNWKKAIKDKSILLAIVAHHPESITKEFILENYQIPCYEIAKGIKPQDLSKVIEQWKENPGILLFTGKGFLLELYTHFKIALVGGGFNKDTHSIIEPYLAGANVYCGPKVHRSSEYFQVKDLDSQKLQSLATIEQWKCDCLHRIMSLDLLSMDLDRTVKFANMRQSLLEQVKVLFSILKVE